MYYLGIYATVFILASTSILLIMVRADHTKTVSQHATYNTFVSRYFAVTLILGATAYDVFLMQTLVPQLDLPKYWLILIGLAILFDWVIALVPVTTKTKMLVHNIAAYGAGLLGLLLVGVLTQNQLVSPRAHQFIICSFILMLLLIPVAVLSVYQPKLYRYTALAIEVLFMGAFFVATLVAVYL